MKHSLYFSAQSSETCIVRKDEMHMKYILAIAFMVFSMTGCIANLESRKPAGTDLSNLKTFYVQKLPEEGRGVERMLADRLTQMGYVATYGIDEPAAPVDAIITYKDDWWWDLSWYLLQLDIQIRDPQTKLILASGHSKRTSLVRKSSDEIVEDVLNETLKGVR
jgi:hypothetical protein